MTSTVPTTPLSRASTIPKRYYLDPDVLELEKDRIFGSTWQLVARTDDLQRIGDFVPVTVLDEPIVITRERWFSPELQLVVFVRNVDPRAGETTYRLTNVRRGEPSADLFRVPGDFRRRNDPRG